MWRLRGRPRPAVGNVGQRGSDRLSAAWGPQPPTSGRARRALGGTARTGHSLHPPAPPQTGRQRRGCDRSRRARSPASCARCDGLRARGPSSSESASPVRLSRQRTGASRSSPEPRPAPASATPASGNWRSCRAPRRIAARPRPNASPSSAVAVSSMTAGCASAPISLSAWIRKFLFQQRWISDAARNEMMQLVVVAGISPSRRHRLDALAVARPNQPSYVERTHPSARLVPKPRQERRKPTQKVVIPSRHPSRSAKNRAQSFTQPQLTYPQSAKVVLGAVKRGTIRRARHSPLRARMAFMQDAYAALRQTRTYASMRLGRSSRHLAETALGLQIVAIGD